MTNIKFDTATVDVYQDSEDGGWIVYGPTSDGRWFPTAEKAQKFAMRVEKRRGRNEIRVINWNHCDQAGREEAARPRIRASGSGPCSRGRTARPESLPGFKRW